LSGAEETAIDEADSVAALPDTEPDAGRADDKRGPGAKRVDDRRELGDRKESGDRRVLDDRREPGEAGGEGGARL